MRSNRLFGVLATLLCLAVIPLARAQTFSVLYNASPSIPITLVLDQSGNIYGTAGNGYGQIFKLDTEGNYSILHAFTNSLSDGWNPYGLVRDSDGNLYGTATVGGAFDGFCRYYFDGCGVIFKLDAAGNYTVLHTLAADGSEGAVPQYLILDAAGNLYGTTYSGGQCSFTEGCGVVFKLDTMGNYTVVHTFRGLYDAHPGTPLSFDAKGNLYGIAGSVLFRLTPSGKKTELYDFYELYGWVRPSGTLARDEAGNFYGTTVYGGSSNCSNEYGTGCGVVYKVDLSGNETILYTFTGKEGSYPYSGLVRGPDGALYGATEGGGYHRCDNTIFQGCGVIFRITRTGKEQTVHRFTGGTDGDYPIFPLVRDESGNLYGSSNLGIIFKISFP